jgi:hypothetical protein
MPDSRQLAHESEPDPTGRPYPLGTPSTSGQMRRVDPAATLQIDRQDATSAISAAEAERALEGDHGDHGGHAGHAVPAGQPGHDSHSNHSTPSSQRGNTAAEREQIAALYVCPMHPEVTSKTAGSCPRCGMALERVEASVDDE